MKRATVILILLTILSMYRICYGLAMEQIGPDSAQGHPTTAQSDWPKGIVEVSRHQSRVYSIWCNGNENFYFEANPNQINELILLFSQSRMRDHEVIIKPAEDKRPVRTLIKKDPIYYNVNLQIIDGAALHSYRRGDKVDTFEPKLTIYADDVLLKHLKVPENVIANCDIKDFVIKSKTAKPIRKFWYGQVQFEDSSPAADFEHGLSTKITLWENGFEEGIQIAKVSYIGFFKAAFSEKEIADLKKGKSQLTMTVGNYLTAAKKEDTRFPVEMLALEKDKAKAVKISRQKFYYGRVLFEDGTPAFLDNEPWPGAEISLSFPYAGGVKTDSQGYFKVYFTEEQYEKVKAKKSSKNIYIPDYSKTGRSTATAAYPVSLLSRDKSKAGIVKIQKPINIPAINLEDAASLVSKALPDVNDWGIELSEAEGKKVLICFFDYQQRPSRHMITELGKRAKELKEKEVVIVGVQASKVDGKMLQEWVKQNNISFPVGIIEEDEKKKRFDWGVKGLPWLILTDKNHIVTAAGFGIDELTEKIKEKLSVEVEGDDG